MLDALAAVFAGILFLTPGPTELSSYSYSLYELCYLNVA
jgi:hypothetical protein